MKFVSFVYQAMARSFAAPADISAFQSLRLWQRQSLVFYCMMGRRQKQIAQSLI
ncbi:hypothetical protein [Novosphingobium sp. CCH12-A3]|uniref:hypothetical protein n=1 Tax=Novosphingobium sp. CCH12-A3 TaxID=1768752 RepID=UPI0012E3C847|nr:hypothetical protein [Novosphingobium sp. CCH12-A3]